MTKYKALKAFLMFYAPVDTV